MNTGSPTTPIRKKPSCAYRGIYAHLQRAYLKKKNLKTVSHINALQLGKKYFERTIICNPLGWYLLEH